MGWQDRDYARASPPPGGAWPAASVMGASGRSIVTILIIVNAVVFVACSMTSSRGSMLDSPIFQFGAMYTPGVLHGEVWRLFTSDYLHWGFGHILMNMIGLHFLGRPLEREWGAKRFFAIYSVAGILGSIFYMLLSKVGWLAIDGVAAGASGCVLGLLGACAVRYPHAKVLIYFLFPIKIRTAALVFGGWYVLNVLTGGPNAGGDACHLAGLLFGAWWAMKGDSWWRRSQWRLPRFGGRFRRSRTRAKPGVYTRDVADRRQDAETIDRILRKVYDGGIHSLSASERTALKEATKRQQARDAQADRQWGKQ